MQCLSLAPLSPPNAASRSLFPPTHLGPPTRRHHDTDIRLDAPIHDTLTANYRGSCAMAQLGARMRRMRSFVYVSTCYVNINKPPGSHVEER